MLGHAYFWSRICRVYFELRYTLFQLWEIFINGLFRPSRWVLLHRAYLWTGFTKFQLISWQRQLLIGTTYVFQPFRHLLFILVEHSSTTSRALRFA